MKPFLAGLWLDKNAISRKPYFDINNKQRVYYNYEDYLPTQQLQAIVTAEIASGTIPLER